MTRILAVAVLAFAFYVIAVNVSLRMLGGQDELAEPWGDC